MLIDVFVYYFFKVSFRGGKHKLRRVESKEHLLNDEEYVVVDFVGHVEISSSSRKSSNVEAPPPATKLLEEGGDDSLPESAIDLTPPSSQSPISNSSTFDEIHGRQLLADDDKVEDVADTEKLDAFKKDETLTPILVDEAPKYEITVSSSNKGVESKSVASPEISNDIEKQPEPVVAQKPPKQSNSPEPVSKPAPPTNVESVSRSSSTRSVSSRKDELSSNNSSRRTSRTSPDKSPRPSSVVMQNKMLFDQQVKDQWKRRTSVESRSSDTSLNSLRDKRNGLPSSGKVAGALSMFESNTPPTGSRKSSLNVKKTEQPDQPPPEKQNEESKVKSTKKKRFPFKKKKLDISAKNDAEPKTDDVKLVGVSSIATDGYDERPIDVPEEIVNESVKQPHDAHEKKKHGGGLISRLRRRSRKSSGEHSDGEEIPEIKTSKNAPIEEAVVELKPPGDTDKTIDLSLDIPPPAQSDTSPPTPDVAPPSPAHASLEVKSVLESIIDRKPSFTVEDANSNNGSVKKKRLKLKKKSNKKVVEPVVAVDAVEVLPDPPLGETTNVPSEVEETLPVDDAAEREEKTGIITIATPSPPVIEDDESIVASEIADDIAKTEWPEEMKHDNNNHREDDDDKDSSKPPRISIELPADDVDGGEEDVSSLLDPNSPDNASSIYSYDEDAISVMTNDSTMTTDSTNPEKKKKKRFKFPIKRKKKDKLKAQQNELGIWEEEQPNNDGKLEKKNSKRLKRPKSLDFLAEVIHPSHKTKEGKQTRPLSVAHGDMVDQTVHPEKPKSPTKKKTLSIFRKKKKNSSEIHNNFDGVIPSPTASSPDVFKIPDVIDAGKSHHRNGNGHVTLTSELSNTSETSDNINVSVAVE